MVRRSLAGLIAIGAFLWWSLPPVAHADTNKANVFIETLGSEVIGMLSDPVLSEEDRVAEFRRLLVNGFDLRTIGRFVLGRHWRRATPAERGEFEQLFEDYIVASYAARLGRYQGETLTVGATRDDGNGDKLVGTEIVPREGPAARVEWRVRAIAGNYKIIDVVVEGVSMVITQRSEFASVIQRSGGQVAGLLTELRKRTERR
jgi:phospholipid transport system substrate-binding protein